MNDFLSVVVSGPFHKMQNRKKLSAVDRSLYVHTNFLKQVLPEELTIG
jgi:tRNA nucleotidyltransferase (CCA-adding enzyme)